MISKLSITLVALLGLGLVIPGWLLAPRHVFAGGTMMMTAADQRLQLRQQKIVLLQQLTSLVFFNYHKTSSA
jgi:hypothetical protein